jgi:catechol 2,3-dioxygenase-like lactoylglutathione lyase family enzyme
MSNERYSRPVLFVADIDRSVDFYLKQLGFTHNWRYEEEGKAWVARQGCELILTAEWPDKTGNGLMFISLDAEVLNALRAELEGRSVDVKEGRAFPRLLV